MLLRSCCPRLHSIYAQQVALLQHGVLLLQQRSARRVSTKASGKHVVAVAPETDINTALEAAADAAGLSLKNAEHLSEQLRSNWYSTAGDVAHMSKEELQQMQIPVRVWAVVKAMVAADSAAAAAASAAAADSLEDRASSELAANTVAGSAAVELQQGDATGEVDATTSAAGQELHPDIMQRRMPRNFVGTNSAGSTRVQVTSKKAVKPYALKDEQLSAALREELSQLERFCCGTFYGQRVEPLRPVSFNVYREELWRMLGWAHTERGVPLEQLRLATLVPSPGREGVSLLMDYQHWRQQERGTASSTATVAIKAVVHVARFLYHDLAKPCAETKLRPYHDLEVVQELNAMQRTASKAAGRAARVADDSKKWLEWPDYLKMVSALRAECAGLTEAGKPRPRSQVAISLQRYLIVAILSVVPDRQRTLRELEVGRTLLQQADGSWVIKHAAADYKTGKQYGDRPPLLIAPFIYPELEAFIGTWRQELAPKTSMLFCKPRTGQPLDESAVYLLFKSAALRLTGKATHPHLVRDMIVTHLRMQRRSEAELEALALYMGHSLEMQRGTYDRRSKDQKVAPAQQLLQQLARQGKKGD